MVNFEDDDAFITYLRTFRKYDVRNAIRSAVDVFYKDVATWDAITTFIPKSSIHERQRIVQELPHQRAVVHPYHFPRTGGPSSSNAMASASTNVASASTNIASTSTTIVSSSTIPASSHTSSPTNNGTDVQSQTSHPDPHTSQSLAEEPSHTSYPDFLKVVDQTRVDACVVDFINKTSNDALKQSVCISCAQRMFFVDQKEVILRDLPNRDLLKPNAAIAHPKQKLTDGMLLASGDYSLDSLVTVCNECLSRLKRGLVPKFSLANGLWVGDIPPELQGLELPERILISLYFPAVYVVKLYPSGRRGKNWEEKKLNSGLKGNVSTYKLDQQQIADMVGLTMPPPIHILSATIAITYVGVNNLPKACLPDTFRVRRAKVQRALIWLKENNPLYRRITISETRLGQLPDNGIPQQIVDTVRWSNEVEKLDDEHGTYVPLNEGDVEDEDDELESIPDETMEIDMPTEDEESAAMLDVPPAVLPLPLKAHGVVDVAGHDIPNDELFAHALTNTAKVDTRTLDGDYAIRHGSAFINEYGRIDPVTKLRYDGGPDNPNHLLGSFPYLFPYGRGGFETEQLVTVSYESHARWAIRYDDGRFRKDFHFIFQVFGVIQKRQVCRAAALQVERISPAVQAQLRGITIADLIQASKEDFKKRRGYLSATHVYVCFEPKCPHPSLWITINLPDTHDPTVQFLIGADINLDDFCKTAGPDNRRRAINVASEPYYAALFFHHTINLVLETLFGIKIVEPGPRFQRKEGILGVIQAFIGMVEAQGRGTLHAHFLLWSKDTPPPSVVRQLLLAESFREHLRQFVRQNIHANIDDKNTAEVLAMKVDKEISYSRPLHPASPTYAREEKAVTNNLARSLQYHRCIDRVCRVVKNGRVVCKRRAPWTLAPDAWVSEDGQWGPKRLCGFLNNWQPTLLRSLRSNHDIKLMLSGSATRNLTWYITNYASKKQGKSSNTSALLAQRFAYHVKQEERDPQPLTLNKRLLQRCANALGRDREFSAPEVMSYLMGWGDRFESHYYVTIRWDLAMKSLFQAYPALRDLSDTRASRNSPNERDEAAENQWDTPAEEPLIIQFVGDTLEVQNQLREYSYRGHALESESFFRFMLDTYDKKLDDDDDNPELVESEIPGQNPRTHRRKPRHDRIPYLEGFSNGKRCRVRRATTHETLPRFSGRWFPRNNDPRTYETYCASMLMLLKPWRTLEGLKTPQETFSQAFDTFMADASPWIQVVVENIQHYYDCADHASATADEEHNSMTYRAVLEDDIREVGGDIEPEIIDPFEGITRESIELARTHKLTKREQDYVNEGLRIAAATGFSAPSRRADTTQPLARMAEADELEQTMDWATQLKAITRERGTLTSASIPLEELVQAAVMSSAQMNETQASVTRNPEKSSGTGTSNTLKALLNAEQRRAHDIIVRCVENEVEGKAQEQLLMVVHGQGGTGKSLLIQAVTQTLKSMELDQYLGKSATSGIAATPIGGNTVHHYFGISVAPRGRDWVSKASDDIKARRLKNIGEKHIVFIDEMSMLTKTLLQRVSEVCQTVRSQSPTSTGNSTLPFGGMHVVLFGDFHQFPPVAGEGNALYCNRPGADNERAAIGRNLYLQFETVVILRQQNRSRDPVWTELLNRLRVGECDDEDIRELEKLLMEDENCVLPDFGTEGWEDAVLVTPRHTMRKAWNRIGLEKHCIATGSLRYIVQAEDEDKTTGKAPTMDFEDAIVRLDEKHTAKLEDRVEIAKGMKAMVMTNIATEADIANGTRGTIEDFWLDPEETATAKEDGSVLLKRLPPVLFFKPMEGTDLEFEGVPSGLIPITPQSGTFGAANRAGEERKFKRRQYAITVAYAFTDYKAQGQTIEKVIIDIGEPPSGKSLTPFNVYVALSRGRGRDSIRLLRSFNADLFTSHPSEELRVEMARLEELDKATLISYEKWAKADEERGNEEMSMNEGQG